MTSTLHVKDPQEIQEAVDILKANGARRVLLFGSTARGKAHCLSDVDLVDLDTENLNESLKQRIERGGVLLYESQ